MNYVLDSFAVIAWLRDEAGAEKTAVILEKAKKKKVNIFMHAINLGEIFYLTYREEGESIADSVYSVVKMYPVKFIDDLSEDFLLSVARLKAAYPVSYADAFAAGLALKKDAVLITGDRDFKLLEMDKKLKVLWIN